MNWKKLSKRFLPFFCALVMCLNIFQAYAAAYSSNYTTYVIGNAHIDNQWFWRLPETIEHTRNTFQSQVDNLKNSANPEYKFNAADAVQYAYIKEYYPALYEDVRDLIAAARWFVTGGAWSQHDTFVISGESTVRQYLLGQTFFENEFGITAKEMFLPDDFGFSAILPQIAAKAGLTNGILLCKGVPNDFSEGYSSVLGTQIFNGPAGTNQTFFNRPEGNNFKQGFITYEWVGVDGTPSIVFNPTGYAQFGLPITAEQINLSLDFSNSLGLNTGIFMRGWGDAGAGPNASSHTTGGFYDDIGALKQYNNNNPSGPNAVWASIDEYFNTLSAADLETIADHYSYTGEMFQRASDGWGYNTALFSTWSMLKTANRKNEIAAEVAEKAASMAAWLGLSDYPAYDFYQAWDKILMNQSHDTMAGCSSTSVTMDTLEEYAFTLNLFTTNRDMSIKAIASAADTTVSDPNGVPVIIHNPLSFERSEVVSATVTFPTVPSTSFVSIKDESGNTVPVQVVSIKGGVYEILFEAHSVPSLGYKIYEVIPSATSYNGNTGLSADAGARVLENDRYTVSINTNGNINSIIDRTANNKELLASPVELQRFVNTKNTALGQAPDHGGYSQWRFPYSLTTQPPRIINDNAVVMLDVSGPVMSRFKVTKSYASYGTSTPLTQYITLYSIGDRVDISDTITWNDAGALLKASFELNVSNPMATYDLSYGAIERGNNQPASFSKNAPVNTNNYELYEVPGHMWADITEEVAPGAYYGVSIFNDSKYGWDKPNDGQIRLTLMSSPDNAIPGQNINDRPDLGTTQTYTYSIFGHQGTWQDADVPAKARELNYPMVVSQVSPHADGGLGKSFSFVNSDKSNVQITAIKNAEDSSGDLILRLVELEGAPTSDVVLTFNPLVTINSLTETDLLEKPFVGNTTKISGNIVKVNSVGKYDIRTIRVSLDTQVNITAVRPVSTPVNLNAHYTRNGISGQMMNSTGFDGNSTAFSTELIENLVDSNMMFSKGNATFQLGNINLKNVVEPNNNTIRVAPHSYNSLYIVGMTTGAPNVNVILNYNSGAPDTNTLAFSKYDAVMGYGVNTNISDMIASTFTHYHIGAADAIGLNNRMYMYKINVDSSRSLQTIELSTNANVKIFAMSLLSNTQPPPLQNPDPLPDPDDGNAGSDDLLYEGDGSTKTIRFISSTSYRGYNGIQNGMLGQGSLWSTEHGIPNSIKSDESIKIFVDVGVTVDIGGIWLTNTANPSTKKNLEFEGPGTLICTSIDTQNGDVKLTDGVLKANKTSTSSPGWAAMIRGDIIVEGGRLEGNNLATTGGNTACGLGIPNIGAPYGNLIVSGDGVVVGYNSSTSANEHGLRVVGNIVITDNGRVEAKGPFGLTSNNMIGDISISDNGILIALGTVTGANSGNAVSDFKNITVTGNGKLIAIPAAGQTAFASITGTMTYGAKYTGAGISSSVMEGYAPNTQTEVLMGTDDTDDDAQYISSSATTLRFINSNGDYKLYNTNGNVTTGTMGSTQNYDPQASLRIFVDQGLSVTMGGLLLTNPGGPPYPANRNLEFMGPGELNCRAIFVESGNLTVTGGTLRATRPSAGNEGSDVRNWAVMVNGNISVTGGLLEGKDTNGSLPNSVGIGIGGGRGNLIVSGDGVVKASSSGNTASQQGLRITGNIIVSGNGRIEAKGPLGLDTNNAFSPAIDIGGNGVLIAQSVGYSGTAVMNHDAITVTDNGKLIAIPAAGQTAFASITGTMTYGAKYTGAGISSSIMEGYTPNAQTEVLCG